ncbi:flagellar biosynthesis protein FlhA [Acidiphilium multivorum AIU301]|uniref:Flagellar biosynthesis protein FlhA n=2 Tax=Acidiphilium TaxID=522 RepID=A5FYJ7_ACICJ|nr:MULTISPECIES: flagellar biosynthesis protein FlhA [Acidiphilium]ABQ30679.1 flagellar biosynthesis protein FlhA [Acidiphilium cryptum JF-5]BAJ80864.1 flagellar biosynthesis protein FlhA [Acidiphilium multivorum AIU301]GAN73647.1 flagellar biosynthesis protein FlhA [Acidiphilium multivorum AIU301]
MAATDLAALRGRLQEFRIGTDIGLAIGVVCIITILIVPLPPFLLDTGLSLSFTASILVLMVSLFIRRPIDFTSFPTVLLLTTLLRLSLDIAATREILSHGSEGPDAAGHVIAAFGGFLMGGDLLIGLIVFAILIVVNFIVITKGSTRVAEVAARFTLDGIPGKQMAIDAELNSGAISEVVARRKRAELEQESGFYGAMDGAAKFVRGDAIAALIITSINIVGGFAIGVVQRGMSVHDAASAFTTLSIGEGLVSQIPALLVSVAAGIVVTKGSAEGTADAALVAQLSRSHKPLAIASAGAFVLAILPGLPFIPFVTLSGLAGWGSYYRWRNPPRPEQEEAAPAPVESAEPPITEALKIDQIRLELGYALLVLAGGDTPRLTEQIKALRRAIAAEMGFILPPVRIQDNMQLAATTYSLRIKEIEAASGELQPTRLLAMSPSGALPDVPGDPTTEPAFGMPAVWIDQADREQALARGCTVVDPASVLTTHLTEVVKENMAELLSFAETQKLLDDLPREQQRLVTDLIPTHFTVGGVQRVLQALLAERVSIRDLPTILEGIHEACSMQLRAVPAIAAHVRTRLARQLTDAHTGSRGYVPLVIIGPEWETELNEALVGPAEARQLSLPSNRLSELTRRINQVFESASVDGEAPVLLTSAHLRAHVRAILERIRPSTPVLAQTEIFPRARIRTVGAI